MMTLFYSESKPRHGLLQQNDGCPGRKPDRPLVHC